MTVAEIEELLATEARDRLFGTGGQLYASVDGEPRIDLAVGVDGVDRPVARDTLFAVYCAAKPAFALAVASLVDDGEVSFDDRLGDVVARDLPAPLAATRIAHLLDHTAGLHRLDARLYLLSSARGQDAAVTACRPPEGWRVGTDVGYSEIAATQLLAHAVESLTGASARDVVRARVLAPAGIGADLFVGGMTPDDYDAARARLGVNMYLSGPVGDPILGERTRRLRCLPSPAVGNTASARGLGRFYESVLRAMLGAGDLDRPATVAAMVTPRSHGPDQVMGRECGYGLGFMVGLGEHRFGRRPGPRAFGHSGYGGMTAAFADPEHDLVVAFHLNGRVDAESAIDYHRPALVDAVYRAVVDRA